MLTACFNIRPDSKNQSRCSDGLLDSEAGKQLGRSVQQEFCGEEEERNSADSEDDALGLFGKDPRASIAGLAEDFEPDEIAAPVDHAKERESQEAELGCLRGQGQSHRGPPEEEIGITGGQQDARYEGAS